MLDLQTMSIKQLEELKRNIDSVIYQKEREIYDEALQEVIKAISKMAELEPYMDACSFEKEVTWKELLDAIENEHF